MMKSILNDALYTARDSRLFQVSNGETGSVCVENECLSGIQNPFACISVIQRVNRRRLIVQGTALLTAGPSRCLGSPNPDETEGDDTKTTATEQNSDGDSTPTRRPMGVQR